MNAHYIIPVLHFLLSLLGYFVTTIMLIGVLVNVRNYKYFRSYYKYLKSGKFYLGATFKVLFNEFRQWEIFLADGSKTQLIYFQKSRCLKLGDDCFMYLKLFTCLEPYSLYWYFKYKKFFNDLVLENIHPPFYPEPNTDYQNIINILNKN